MALARRLDDTGTCVVAVNPGMAWTPGVAALTPQAVPHWRYIWPIVRWIQRRASAHSAAQNIVRLVLGEPPPRSGSYYDGWRQKPLTGALLDPVMQDRAWHAGEVFVGGSG